MKNVIFIKSYRGVDAGDWFLGEGYYFIDETKNLQWAGNTKAEAEDVYIDYVVNLETIL